MIPRFSKGKSDARTRTPILSSKLHPAGTKPWPPNQKPTSRLSDIPGSQIRRRPWNILRRGITMSLNQLHQQSTTQGQPHKRPILAAGTHPPTTRGMKCLGHLAANTPSVSAKKIENKEVVDVQVGNLLLGKDMRDGQTTQNIRDRVAGESIVS